MFLLTKVSRRFGAEDLVRKTTEQERIKRHSPQGPPIDQFWKTSDEYIRFVSQPPLIPGGGALTLQTPRMLRLQNRQIRGEQGLGNRRRSLGSPMLSAGFDHLASLLLVRFPHDKP
jgi:hypothetical protein